MKFLQVIINNAKYLQFMIIDNGYADAKLATAIIIFIEALFIAQVRNRK